MNKKRVVITHVHIFKNAGTSFDWILKKNFRQNFLDHRKPKEMRQGGAKYLKNIYLDTPKLVAVSSHHIPFDPIEMEDDNLKILPVYLIREPIERTLSVYKFEKKQKDVKNEGTMMAKKLEFPEYVKWSLTDRKSKTLRNMNTMYASGVRRVSKTIELEHAFENLKNTPLTGVVDRFDESMVVFEEALKVYFPKIDLAYVAQNVNQKENKELSVKIQEIQGLLGEKLFEDTLSANKSDLKLYSFANKILDERIKRIASFQEKLTSFKQRSVDLLNKKTDVFRNIKMGQGYQGRDYEIIDYELYNINTNIQRPFRGPVLGELSKGEYIVCIGAAQTFGCYAEEPYPYLIYKELNIPVLNLGVAGAGPSFFNKDKALLELINNAKFAIVQVMSGRSVSNSEFISDGGEMLTRVSDNIQLGAAPCWKEALETHTVSQVQVLVKETRNNWIKDTVELLTNIKVPKVSFWFSQRSPEYHENYDNVFKLFGKYPQLVNHDMIEQIKPFSDYYVESVSSDGMPQVLYSRFTGEETSINMRKDLGGRKKKKNNYYPTPEMHKIAFENLIEICQKIINNRTNP